MKKILSLILVGTLLAGSAFAGESAKGNRNMAFTWNPLSLLALTFSGSYGIGVSEKVALIVPLDLMYVATGVSDGNNSASGYLFGISSGLGVRFYFTGGAFEDGFYIQPNGHIGWLKFGSNGLNALLIGGNALLGYSWVWDSGFIMNLAGGAAYYHTSVGTDSKAGVFNISGVLPAVEFAIGYAW